jgi:hypothetical protein
MALADSGPGTVTALDFSSAALDLLKALSQDGGQVIRTLPWDALDSPLPQGPFQLVTLGHVLNELWPTNPDSLNLRLRLVGRCLDVLAPGGALLILEPALFNTTREALALRDALVKAGHPLWYPCLWRGACPALAQETGTCHSELAWEPPKLVRDLAYAAGLNKEALKAAVLIFGKSGQAWPSAPEGKVFRIVSDPMLNKGGRTRIFGCGPEGRLALSARRDRAGSWKRNFFGLKRGDLVRLENAQARENGYGLEPESGLEVLEKIRPSSGRQRGTV